MAAGRAPAWLCVMLPESGSGAAPAPFCFDQVEPDAQRLDGRPFGAALVEADVEQEIERDPQQAADIVAAFGMAAEPQQVLRHAARQVGVFAHQVFAGGAALLQAVRVHLARACTQVSLLAPPICIVSTRASGPVATRVRPPGITT